MGLNCHEALSSEVSSYNLDGFKIRMVAIWSTWPIRKKGGPQENLLYPCQSIILLSDQVFILHKNEMMATM